MVGHPLLYQLCNRAPTTSAPSAKIWPVIWPVTTTNASRAPHRQPANCPQNHNSQPPLHPSPCWVDTPRNHLSASWRNPTTKKNIKLTAAKGDPSWTTNWQPMPCYRSPDQPLHQEIHMINRSITVRSIQRAIRFLYLVFLRWWRRDWSKIKWKRNYKGKEGNSPIHEFFGPKVKKKCKKEKKEWEKELVQKKEKKKETKTRRRKKNGKEKKGEEKKEFNFESVLFYFVFSLFVMNSC